MPDRPKLEIVDDPVTGRAGTTAPPAAAAAPASPDEAASADAANADGDDSQHEPQTPAARPPARRPQRATAADPDEPVRTAQPVRSYGQEEKRAVFGRVPRSLSRRLERAVFELRDEFEDLTQEQVLAALLHEHVDASDPGVLADLTETVRRYRRELGRQ